MAGLGVVERELRLDGILRKFSFYHHDSMIDPFLMFHAQCDKTPKNCI